MSVPVLEAHHVSKYFQNQRQKMAAVQAVSLKVHPGEFVCLLGPSGSGKTTLLRLLAGLIPPDEGQIHLNGLPLTEATPKIGLVFQKANLMPWRTVLDNVLLPLQIAKLPAETALARVKESLHLVQLSQFETHYPHQLSGGMQQRVALARALVANPSILLLDEPFGALDALTRETLNQALLDIWQTSQSTILMVTHNIQEAVFLADRICVLSPRPGRITSQFQVDLPRPRNPELHYQPELNDLARQIRAAIQ